MRALDFHSNVRVIQGDATRLPPTPEPCSYAFLDPPYRGGKAEPALESLAHNNWLVEDAFVVVETSAKEVLASLDGYQEIDRRRYGATEIVFLLYRPLATAK